MGLYQVLQLQAREDLGTIAIKGTIKGSYTGHVGRRGLTPLLGFSQCKYDGLAAP